MNRRPVAVDPATEFPLGRVDVGEELGDPLSPYLRTDEAARFLRFDGPRARALFRKWALRHRVPVCRRGRTLLYERRVLEAFLKGQDWTVRRAVHGSKSARGTG